MPDQPDATPAPGLTPEQLQELLDAFYPYQHRYPVHDAIPATGLGRDEVLAQVAEMAVEEDRLGDSGKVSGSLYLGDHEQYAFLTEVFARYAHANVLQRDMYPSATKFEGEIVAMTARMLHGDAVGQHHPGQQVAGVVTSGGTESLVESVLVYRERGRAERGITAPQVIVPASAHVAIDKACHYFGVELVRAPLRDDFRVDVDWVRDHVTEGLRPLEKYLDGLPQIRELQDFIVERARRHDVPVIFNDSLDRALGDVMDLVLRSADQLAGVAR